MKCFYPLLILMLVAGAGCGRQQKAEQQKAEAAAAAKRAEPIQVRTVAAETRRVDRALLLTGSLHPDETVSVSAEVAGRLTAIRFDFGQSVKKGEVIAELDKTELQLQVDRSKAALAQALARLGLDPGQADKEPSSTPAIRQAQAQAEDAKFKYDSAAKLVASGDVSRERYVELEKALRAREAALESVRDELRMQWANIQALRSEVKLAEKRLRDTTMVAPFDGAISEKLVSPGQYIKENTTVVKFVKTNPLRLRVDIPESDAVAARVGTQVTFTTDAVPDVKFSAVIRELNPALDEKSRSLTAEARMTSTDPRLRPGTFVQVRLLRAQQVETVVVPREAVSSVAGLSKVYVVRGAKAIAVKVNPGQQMENWVEAGTEEIKPGELVATSNVGQLSDGADVRTLSASTGGKS